MQEETLKLYEKIEDKLSKEEFLAEIEEMRDKQKDVEFLNETDLAIMVLENHGVKLNKNSSSEDENSEDLPFEVSFDKDDESEDAEEEIAFTMNDDILEFYNKVKDVMTEQEFLDKMVEYKNRESHNPYINETSLAELVANEHVTEEVEVVSEKPEYNVNTIDGLEKESKDVTVEGRVISISNPRSFKTRKGKEGQVCNVELVDNTGSIRCVFWTQNIKLLKNVNEGDIIQIKNVDIKEGYTGLEANLRQRSTVIHLDEDPSRFPEYNEEITNIEDIEPETKVNIIARIVRIPSIRSYEKNGKEGKVASLELQDATGHISYTLWNKNVELISDLDLNEGDTIKITAAQARERNNRDGIPEISLTHWDGRIVKGDYDVPEVTIKYTPIGDLSEQNDVAVKGIVVRLQDIKTFNRKTDNTEGKLRNFDLKDTTGTIRVTFWGDDATLPLNKGDIVKIIGGNSRFDEYTQSGYSLNTNFNTQISINPTNLPQEEVDELKELAQDLGPIPISKIKEVDEDGYEVDIVGRIVSINEPNKFDRDDGSVGIVRSILFADGSGEEGDAKVQLSFWNEKAEGDYEVGEIYLVENGRTRLGMYDVDLNIGGGARIIRLSEEEASEYNIPSLEVLEDSIYKYIKIEDLDEDERDIIIVGRIIELSDIHTFERSNGDQGKVRNMEVADDTGAVRVSLWDDDVNIDFEEGDAIRLQNPRITYNEARVEASVSRNTKLSEATEIEIEELPTFDELREVIYASKKIEAIAEDDTNVCITAKIAEVDTNRNLLKRCPFCNASVEEDEEEGHCIECGNVFDEPKNVLMIPTKLEDETGEIQATFFNQLAEELIGMKTEDIAENLDEGFGIGEKLEELINCNVEIIADVSFDEYSETSRLNPKKILNKYY